MRLPEGTKHQALLSTETLQRPEWDQYTQEHIMVTITFSKNSFCIEVCCKRLLVFFQRHALQGPILCCVEQLSLLSSLYAHNCHLIDRRGLFTCVLNIPLSNSSVLKGRKWFHKKWIVCVYCGSTTSLLPNFLRGCCVSVLVVKPWKRFKISTFPW